MQYKTTIAILISLLSFSFVVTGQKQVNSPYARFNIGALEPAASFRSLGMGGVGIGMRSNNSIYFSNPASYSSLDTNSFNFDIGLDYSINKISNGVEDFTSEDMNFDHIIMGFPITKGWGMALGIVPLSSGYYKLSETVAKNDPEYDPVTGGYEALHGGSGGMNNFFLGSGIQINKHFSLGINMSLLFGEVDRTYQVFFADYNNVYHNNSIEKLQLHGLNFDFGLQYSTKLRNDYFLNAGASICLGKNYHSAYEQLAYMYTMYNTKDTITYVSDDSTSAFIPGTLRLGISFGKKDKFTAGFDYLSTKWSKAKIPGADGYTADTRSILFGIEYIPEKYSNYSFFKRVEYRVGGHLGDNYLIINNEQIKESGVSFGFGLPMRRTYSRTNFFFDYTRKSGSGSATIHIEHYYTMGVSLNLYDFWFIKRKYN
jgi:hypothetical protein